MRGLRLAVTFLAPIISVLALISLTLIKYTPHGGKLLIGLDGADTPYMIRESDSLSAALIDETYPLAQVQIVRTDIGFMNRERKGPGLSVRLPMRTSVTARVSLRDGSGAKLASIWPAPAMTLQLDPNLLEQLRRLEQRNGTVAHPSEDAQSADETVRQLRETVEQINAYATVMSDERRDQMLAACAGFMKQHGYPQAAALTLAGGGSSVEWHPVGLAAASVPVLILALTFMYLSARRLFPRHTGPDPYAHESMKKAAE